MLENLHMVDWDVYLHAKGRELFDETLEQLRRLLQESIRRSLGRRF